jgi:hypothetical protein
MPRSGVRATTPLKSGNQKSKMGGDIFIWLNRMAVKVDQ